MATPDPTAEQLRIAVCAWDPFDDSVNSKQAVEPLIQLHFSETFGSMPLGKLCGEARITLIPGRECLSFTEIDPESYRELECAERNTAAIRYPYGHPSDDQTYFKIKSDADLTLRYFVYLGGSGL